MLLNDIDVPYKYSAKALCDVEAYSMSNANFMKVFYSQVPYLKEIHNDKSSFFD